MKSIIQDEKECYWCGSRHQLECHHVFNGPYRKKADEYGLTILLCRSCHNKLHNGKESKEMKAFTKQIGQMIFEKKYDHDLFMYVFKKNYL